MTTTLTPMDPRRHAAVRDLLVAEAGRAHPPRRSPSRVALAGGLVAATAVTAVVLVVADPGPSPSYASWTAVPETAPGRHPADGDLAAWSSQCSDLGVGGVSIEGVPPRVEEATARTPLVDRRGDFTFCVDVARGSGTEDDPLVALAGIRADDGPLEELNTMWARVEDQPFTPPAADEVLVLTGDVDTPPPPPEEDDVRMLEAYQLAGLAGPDVDSVVVVLANGLRVVATVQDGVWGAWWPAQEGAPGDSRLEVGADGAVHTVVTAAVGLT
ncbi:hypothetical protein [Nocardioides sp. 1609]|uniref:hypothetical protein n=1 Tax=Nocardioides sp. 1609 TaxID=2508327 RepID=UPI001070133A|nr:hypothetical protein [Nocardioides sp. 1609]